jgi:hypothetical protein
LRGQVTHAQPRILKSVDAERQLRTGFPLPFTLLGTAIQVGMSANGQLNDTRCEEFGRFGHVLDAPAIPK